MSTNDKDPQVTPAMGAAPERLLSADHLDSPSNQIRHILRTHNVSPEVMDRFTHLDLHAHNIETATQYVLHGFHSKNHHRPQVFRDTPTIATLPSLRDLARSINDQLFNSKGVQSQVLGDDRYLPKIIKLRSFFLKFPQQAGTTPMAVVNIRPLKEDSAYHESVQKVTGHIFDGDASLREKSFDVNVSEKNQIFEMHFDELAGINTLVGGTKLWLFYPYTELRTMVTVQHTSPRNSSQTCLARMMHGLFIVQREGDTVYVPALTPHMTVTLDACGLLAHCLDIPGKYTLVPRISGALDGYKIFQKQPLLTSQLESICNDI